MKNTLKTGDLVVLANGKFGTILKGTEFGDIIKFHSEFGSFSYLDSYRDDLVHIGNERHSAHPTMDVIAVHRAVGEPDKIGDLIMNPDKMISEGKLIFERERSFEDEFDEGEGHFEEDEEESEEEDDELINLLCELLDSWIAD